MRELKYEELIINTEFGTDFETTEKLDFTKNTIGQEKAVKAIKFGMKMNMPNYNIFISGAPGTGRTSHAELFAKKTAKLKPPPFDYCYLYNFDKPSSPIAVSLDTGKGKIFKKDMEKFISGIKEQIPKILKNDEYETQKANMIRVYQNERGKLIDKLNEKAKKQSFKLKTGNTGVYFLPIIDGQVINDDQYDELEESEKNKIRQGTQKLQINAIEILNKIRTMESDIDKKLEKWQRNIVADIVQNNIKTLIEDYKDNSKLQIYFKKLVEDILDNIEDFLDEGQVPEQMPALPPFLYDLKSNTEDRYSVNLFVDNSELKGAPVIVDFNPTYYNLLGRAEYESEQGSMITDYKMIKPGLLHNANGGYLILNAEDIIKNIQSWEALKRALKTQKIAIENLQEHLGLVAVSTLTPEPIPLEIKVILIGSSEIYHLLYDFDEDFNKLFKIRADFDNEMKKDLTSSFELAGFVGKFCKKNELLPFTKDAMIEIIREGSRQIEDRDKLSTNFNDLVELVTEASTLAKIDRRKKVTKAYVKRAITEKEGRLDMYDKKLLEYIQDNTIIIDTTGEVIGQVNGLSVIDMGDYAFGKPSRITATTYVGKSGIVNIEREVEMSGTSHSKGVLILTGYLGQKFAQNFPLALTANLCFEQLYSGIDGDSASAAELCAILSSLSEIPVKQSIAITGSVNQRGEIQPIGGVNQKIEGFFELCKIRGLTNSQGVIIPVQNIKNLILKDEVLEAVKENKFHIYPINNIDEGIEVLTGVKVGTKLEGNEFDENTVYGKVYQKLKKFAQFSKK